MMYSATLSIDCPYCLTKCQFKECSNKTLRNQKQEYHLAFQCTHCNGQIVIRFEKLNYSDTPGDLIQYHPSPSDWKPKVDVRLIADINVQKDFLEAIKCYSSSAYNAAAVMARRAIHQEMCKRELHKKYPNNLYEQIRNSGLSTKLQELLQCVKNFGNYGAHPDFCLYDNDHNEINNEKEIAELSLNFLDKYFSDEYEVANMIKSAPISEKEMSEGKNNH